MNDPRKDNERFCEKCDYDLSLHYGDLSDEGCVMAERRANLVHMFWSVGGGARE